MKMWVVLLPIQIKNMRFPPFPMTVLQWTVPPGVHAFVHPLSWNLGWPSESLVTRPLWKMYNIACYLKLDVKKPCNFYLDLLEYSFWEAGGMAQAVKHLPSKHKTLNSKPSTVPLHPPKKRVFFLELWLPHHTSYPKSIMQESYVGLQQ
jgi:hypothetical protein